MSDAHEGECPQVSRPLEFRHDGSARPIGQGRAIIRFDYDQRIRLEGYDIEWMMDAVGMNAPVPVLTQKLAEVPASPEESRG